MYMVKANKMNIMVYSIGKISVSFRWRGVDDETTLKPIFSYLALQSYSYILLNVCLHQCQPLGLRSDITVTITPLNSNCTKCQTQDRYVHFAFN